MKKNNDFYKSCKKVNTVLFTETLYLNLHQVVKLKKISVSANIIPYSYDNKKIEQISNDILKITGQNPIIKKAQKSISSLNLKAGLPVSLVTTLHGYNMYKFLEKCLKKVFPKLREFNGLDTNSFDKNGHYSFFINDRFVFSEINYDESDLSRGFMVVCSTTSKNLYESYMYMKKIKMPFII